MQNVYPRSQRHATHDEGERRSRLFHRHFPVSKTFVVVEIFRFRHRIAMNEITSGRIQGFMYVLVPSFRLTPGFCSTHPQAIFANLNQSTHPLLSDYTSPELEQTVFFQYSLLNSLFF